MQRSFPTVNRRLYTLMVMVMTFGIMLPMAQTTATTAAPISSDSTTSRAQKVGQTQYLTDAAPGDHLDLALDYLRDRKADWNLSDLDLEGYEVTDRYVSAHNNVTHMYLRQRVNGIPVFNGVININVAGDGRIINVGNSFVPNLAKAVNASKPQISAIDAVKNAAQSLDLPVTEAIRLQENKGGPTNEVMLSGGGVSLDSIPAKLMYEPLGSGNVRLAWDIVLRLPDGEHWLDMRVDAITGKVLASNNWIINEPASEPLIEFVSGENEGGAATERPALVEAPAQQVVAPPTASYEVFALPKESPYDGPRTLEVNPEELLASPYGWHDTNGDDAPEYTITRGNNVHAYQDSLNIDVSMNDEPDGGPSLFFSFTMNLNQEPISYTQASVVNLFYWNNMVHDVFYQYGFDEAGGNFQQNNYGRGGLGGDYVQAQAQDGGGTNNANFGTPPDGQLPRMQMYLGSGRGYVRVNSPANIAADYLAGLAGFGPSLLNFPNGLTGDVVYVNDGVAAPGGGTVNDGCEAISTDLTGKVALVNRGLCAFTVKVKNAQNAGASGVIVANTLGRGAFGLGGTDASITIPAVGISEANGLTIKAELANPVNATLLGGQAKRDGSLDNGVIIHEYGHGISNRLAGGPANAGCLSGQEQAGEGWSDWFALAMTAQASDTRTTTHPIGNWLFDQPINGPGIRPAPYTTNTAINGLTYDDIKNPAITEPHGIGTVFATMLWEMYWNLVDKYGYDPDLYSGNGGNNVAIQLVTDGLTFQPCGGTFIDFRDAILTADMVDNDSANQCDIWEAFSKRGLGYSASDGGTNGRDDGTEAYDLAPICAIDATPALIDVCKPNPALFNIAAGPSIPAGAYTLSTVGAPAGTVSVFTPPTITAPSGTSLLTLSNTAAAANGLYDFDIVGTSGSNSFTDTVSLTLADSVPTTPAVVAPINGAINQSTKPTLTWTSTQGYSFTVQVARDANFTNLMYSEMTGDTSFTIPTSLRSNGTYWWRVMASNGCGVSATSAAASFTVRTTPKILLVDDDNAAAVAGLNLYTEALDALNAEYDVTNTQAEGEPDSATLDNYDTVLWFGGEAGVPSTNSDAAMTGFLEQGGCYFLSSQENFARNGVTTFTQKYLGVQSSLDDSMHTVITGTGLFASAGPYTLSYPFQNYSDHLAPNATAQIAFLGNGAKGSGAAISKDGLYYRTIYFGFPVEAISAAADRKDVMEIVLNRCDFNPSRLHLPMIGR